MTQKNSQTSVKLALPRQFREIRLELAREAAHPEGSRKHGYRLIAPVCTENLAPDVVVVKSTKDEVRFDASDPLNGARDGRILVQ